MKKTYIVTGTLTDRHTIALDEVLPLSPMKVRVVLQPLIPSSKRSYQEVMEGIRIRQRARGHQPPTQQEVDAILEEERASWGK